MKHTLRLLLCLACCLVCRAFATGQERPDTLRRAGAIFRNFAGYLDEDDHKYHIEGEGYNIVITRYNRHPNASTFRNIAENLPGRKHVLQDKLNNKPLENYVIDATVKKHYPPVAAREYLIAGKDSTVLQISIARYNTISEPLVNEIVSSIFYDGLFDSMLVDTKNSVVDFAGRNIKFTGDCFWHKPHTIKCANTGAITWTFFNTVAEAEAYRQLEMDIAKHNLGKRMKQDTARVPIFFERKAALANRYMFESNEFSLVFKGNRLVNAYYIAAEVRGRYMYCCLIFSDVASRDADPESGLPGLIAQFMKFR